MWVHCKRTSSLVGLLVAQYSEARLSWVSSRMRLHIAGQEGPAGPAVEMRSKCATSSSGAHVVSSEQRLPMQHALSQALPATACGKGAGG